MLILLTGTPWFQSHQDLYLYFNTSPIRIWNDNDCLGNILHWVRADFSSITQLPPSCAQRHVRASQAPHLPVTNWLTMIGLILTTSTSTSTSPDVNRYQIITANYLLCFRGRDCHGLSWNLRLPICNNCLAFSWMCVSVRDDCYSHHRE